MKKLMAILLVVLCVGAWGQETKPATAAPEPSKVDALLKMNTEINLLMGIVPMGMTREQYTKLHDALVASRDEAVKEQKAQEVKEADALKKMDAKVRAAYDRAFKGDDPGEEYYKAWDAMLTASAVDRTNLRIKTVKAIAEKVKAIFTDEQYKKGVDSAKEAIKKASGGKLPDPKKFGDDSMFRYYVENMLMGDLSIELLDKLSK